MISGFMSASNVPSSKSSQFEYSLSALFRIIYGHVQFLMYMFKNFCGKWLCWLLLSHKPYRKWYMNVVHNS